MHNHFKYLIFCSLAATLFITCKQDDSDDNGGTCGSMTCTIDGQPWTASSFSNLITISAGSAGNESQQLNITANSADGTRFNIVLNDLRNNTVDCVTEETYLGDVSQNFCESTFPGGGTCSGFIANYYPSPSASVGTEMQDTDRLTITQCDVTNTTFSGTFSFDVIDFWTDDTMKVRNGVFNNVCYTLVK